jgi:multisubunit Na+/H+ antiporter MnhF subunit
MLRNGYALIVSATAAQVLGVLYWIIAARTAPAAVVGRNATAISVMLFLAGVGRLVYDSRIYLPGAGLSTAGGGGPMTSHHAAGTFTVASWEEDTYQDLAGQEKLTKARMGFRLTGDLAGDLVSDSLMYYREDGTAEYTGLQRFTGQIAGRSGTCVMIADGGYDGGEARSTWRVIPGSGTEDLAGLAGSGVSVAAAGQPGGTYSLDYELG